MSHYVDIHVGQKIRRRRWMTDMTQKQLADAVGIKFQQIQKYETGANRVSASRLFEISQALSVPVSYFFEAIETDLNCYYRWPEEQRRRLFELTKSLTKESFADAA